MVAEVVPDVRFRYFRSVRFWKITSHFICSHVILVPMYSFYADLQAAGVLQPLRGHIEGEARHPEGSKHFVAPDGTGSIVQHFLQRAGNTPWGWRTSGVRGGGPLKYNQIRRKMFLVLFRGTSKQIVITLQCEPQ